jgi:methionyl-tRNA formyltransferase
MSAAKLLFAGTPDFALASLRALVESGHTPIAVLTQPDRPAGRGKKLTASPVKQYALEQSLPVLQPQTLRDAEIVDTLSALQPDLMIVAAYGLLLPQSVLDIPAHGCLNVHASLLPRWRGAAPIQQAILAGDQDTGVCLMQMEAGLDTGPVFASRSIRIGDEETAGELHDRLAVMGGELLVEHLEDILSGASQAEPQDEERATYAGKIQKADARLDWSEDAATLARKVRAYNPVPGAWFEFGDERIKCWSATTIDAAEASAGTVLNAGKAGIDVACGSGSLRLTELQRPGRRRIPAGEVAAQLDLAGQQFA